MRLALHATRLNGINVKALLSKLMGMIVMNGKKVVNVGKFVTLINTEIRNHLKSTGGKRRS